MNSITPNKTTNINGFQARLQRVLDKSPGDSRPVSAVLITVGLVAIYAIINLVFPDLPIDTTIKTYVMQPLFWVIIIFSVYLMPEYQIQAKIRTRNYFVWLGLGIALFQIILFAIGGLFSGFGRNPASHTALGIAGTMFYIVTFLIALELSRTWLATYLSRYHPFIATSLVAIFFTLISIPLSQLSSFKLEMVSTNIILSTWLPLLAENLLATLLVLLAGARASLVYRGLLAAFWWLCPILPDLSWVFKAIIGTMAPVMGIIIVYNYHHFYSVKSKVKRSKKNVALPIGWISIAVVCLVIVWFAVGIFPFHPSVVGSGSMSPTLQTGDVVIVSKIPAEKIKVGDTIEFRRDSTTKVIHRVISIDSSTGSRVFFTKGDANNVQDENPVNPDNLIGRVLWRIPKIGWVSFWIKALL